MHITYSQVQPLAWHLLYFVFFVAYFVIELLWLSLDATMLFQLMLVVLLMSVMHQQMYQQLHCKK
ncbi:hypothetical protein L208DRAFT_1497698, partial [Tricholoma matsutake]